MIEFFKLAGPYGCFSNFYRRAFGVDGREYPTNEHYFQSMKFTDIARQIEVASTKTPSGAARMGRTPHPSYRTDWDAVKDSIMLRGVRAKFSQHSDLGEILVGTGEARIVEHIPDGHPDKDAYWADGGDGTGRNQLGITLMIVRFELGGHGVV